MELIIEKLIYGGFGMGRLEGKAVFVPYAAPGDLLDVEITKKHKGYDEAVIKKVIQPADCRVTPKCKYYGVCGGCHLQHIDYKTQLYWKRLILEEQLVRIARINEPDVWPSVESPEVWNYRNRIQIHKQGDKVGFLEKESDRIVDIDYCAVADDGVNRDLQKVRDTWPSKEDNRLHLGGLNGLFGQVNPCANEELRRLVVEWAGAGVTDKVLELYAGSGNLTAPLAEIAKEVVAVEVDPKAVEELGKIERVSAVCLEAERFNYDSRYDLVVADPPREGLGHKIVKNLLILKPSRIIYVSCNPSTLARDLKKFIEGGYVLERSQPLDMFPQTYHIESISILRLK